MKSRRRMSPIGWISLAGGCGCALLVVIVIGVIVLWMGVIRPVAGSPEHSSSTANGASEGSTTAPSGVPEDADYLQFGASDGAPVVDLHTDYLCPYCGEFEEVNGEDLADLVDAQEVTLRLHPRTFLDPQSAEGDYSTRAANAVACTYDQDPQQAFALGQKLWEKQPKEGEQGLSDQDLTDLAHEAGAGDSVDSCISDQRYADWLHDVVEKQGVQKASGTPAVFIDENAWGESGQWQNAGELRSAIEDAA